MAGPARLPFVLTEHISSLIVDCFDIVFIFCNFRGHRQGVITKPEYYMAIAKLSEERSKDKKTQVCISKSVVSGPAEMKLEW